MEAILFCIVGALVWGTIWTMREGTFLKNFVVWFFIFLAIVILAELFPSLGSSSDDDFAPEIQYDRR
jgi:hypothetical protein